MDRLVPGAWLEKQLAAPELRILDCTVSRAVLPQGAPSRSVSVRQPP
jgi:hypothetical protein